MTCIRCQNLLSGYADGSLPTAHVSRIQAHLSGCESCRRQLEELVALKRLLGSVETPDAGLEFWTAALKRIPPGAARRRRALRAVLGIRVAGAAIVALVIGYAMLRQPAEYDSTNPQAPVAVATFDPAALVSMHAQVRAGRPLADTGKVRFAIIEGNARDYANDDQLDSQ